MRIAMFVTWFGEPPAWEKEYLEQLRGNRFEWWPILREEFMARAVERIGVKCPPLAGTTKVYDFRPAFGEIFQLQIGKCDFWGYTDMDCVYGRLDHFWNDKVLENYDVVTDHDTYMCGPWTLYRNKPEVNGLFRRVPNWKEIMERPSQTGGAWGEQEFTHAVNASELRVLYKLQHAWTHPELLHREGERLMHNGVEVPMYHFRRSKRWPL